jgi:hypothetical protein
VEYLSLFLMGLLNPVVRTMRGGCAASRLQRVQEEICRRPVSLGSFSEAQAVLDPALLARVFDGLSRDLSSSAGGGSAQRPWLIQDSSLFEALPRMHWCLWRRQGQKQSQVRNGAGQPGSGRHHCRQGLRTEGLAGPMAAGRCLRRGYLLRGRL